jgi:ubiquinone/menaquinone biosynthesis C-methylase UbiE
MTTLNDRDSVIAHYSSQERLAVRVHTHALYTQPQTDYTSWVLDQMAWRGDETAIDVGCGSGAYVAAVSERAGRYVACDLSFGMLAQQAQPGRRRVNLDAQRLPFARDSAEIILANHMIYHIPDQDAACREFSRVLKPGGTLIAATNSQHTLRDLRLLLDETAVALGSAPIYGPTNTMINFTLENGAALLSQYFGRVARHDLSSALVFDDPQPLLDYISSMQDWHQDRLSADISWEAFMTALRARLDTRLRSDGLIRIGKKTGVFYATNSADRNSRRRSAA